MGGMRDTIVLLVVLLVLIIVLAGIAFIVFGQQPAPDGESLLQIIGRFA